MAPTPAEAPKPRILLVDDTPANLLALEAALESVDAEVVTANSGYEALRHLLDHDCVAIILDVKMPGIDGFETATLIRSRERFKHTPILFLTAFHTDEQLYKGYGLGAVDFLLKPIAPEVLRAKVKVFIELARKAQVLERLAEEVRALNAGLEEEVEKRTAELRAAQQAADSANQAKSRFLANISHELRTPLNAVIGYAEMLEELADERGAPDFIPDLQKIRYAGTHLLQLINDILDLSRIEAGKLTVSVQSFEICPMLEEVSNVVEPMMRKNGNALRIDSPTERLRMTSDPTRVRQCLLNLLSNAAKFTHNGTVDVSAQREGSNHVVFRVSDTGPGLSQDQIAHLFQPFTQFHTDHNPGGTGLGLAITRRLCEALYGDISVESEVGKGSTFSLKLPLVS